MAYVLACNSSGILTLIESLILMRVSALARDLGLGLDGSGVGRELDRMGRVEATEKVADENRTNPICNNTISWNIREGVQTPGVHIPASFLKYMFQCKSRPKGRCGAESITDPKGT